ncbi:Serine protease OS=Streptomyces fumanus OX=67302 GN=GCM10018772_45550 PE=3 SV=1 [Streptomyces fumanus]
MKRRRTSGRRAVAGAGIAGLVAVAVTFQTASAGAAPAPEPLSAAAAGKLASALLTELGGDGRHVLRRRGPEPGRQRARRRRRADRRGGGREARVVAHSLADLGDARAVLKRDATVPGTSWVTDPIAGKVVVTADRTVSGARGRAGEGGWWARRPGRTPPYGREVQPFLAGGDAITGNGGRCSLGFNVTRGGAPYFLTAGHCTESASTWSDSSGTVVGRTAASSLRGDDLNGVVE